MGHKVRNKRKAASLGSGEGGGQGWLDLGRDPRDTGSFMVFPKEQTLEPNVNVNHILKGGSSGLLAM